MIKSNKLFCYPDTLQNKFIPQAWQITIMSEFIKKEDREISFYTGENHKTYKKLSLFKKKMISQNNLKGFVFYSFIQFCYDKNNNLSLIEQAIKKKYEIYFAREKIILRNISEFKKKKKELIYFKLTNKKVISAILDNF